MGVGDAVGLADGDRLGDALADGSGVGMITGTLGDATVPKSGAMGAVPPPLPQPVAAKTRTDAIEAHASVWGADKRKADFINK